MNPGIAQNVAAQFFLSTPYQVNQFNNATPENGNNLENIASSKYYGIDENV